MVPTFTASYAVQAADFGHKKWGQVYNEMEEMRNGV
jgi:hypothetical protein